MTIIRPPAIAGTFYAANPDELRRDIAGLMSGAMARSERSVASVRHNEDSDNSVPQHPKAIIVPHAGLMYSGAIAADGFTQIQALRDQIKRVVIIGPAHRMAFQGIALPKADAFATPIGQVQIDADGVKAALSLPQVQILDAAHVQEHGLEIELPFLQHIFGDTPDITIVPLLVSRCSPRQIHELIEKLWGGPETLLVISSDLSHFYDDATARAKDARTRQLIESLRPEDLDYDDACGCMPIVGLLMAARKRGMTARTLSMANSGDVSGDRSRVVGYGAWAFFDPAGEMMQANGAGGAKDTDFVLATETLLARHGKTLLELAAHSIRYGLEHGTAPAPADIHPDLVADGACFVTLKKSSALRGCIGSVMPWRGLAQDVCENAFKAAFGDPRFARLSPDELDVDLEISISVLSPPQPFPFEDDLIARLTPFEDGVILSEGNRRGLFLPQVWEQLPDPADFVAHLKRKAGLPMDYWSETLRAERFISRSTACRAYFDPGAIWRHPQ